MRLRRRHWFLLGLLAIVSVVLITGFRRADSVTFNSVRVNTWFERHFGASEEVNASEKAFRAMGTKALPYLRQKLREPDDGITHRVYWAAMGQARKYRPVRAQLSKRGIWMDEPLDGETAARATCLMAVAGGREVIPELIALLGDPRPDVRIVAASALSSFGSDAGAALPALTRLTNDMRPGLFASGPVGPSAQEAIPCITGEHEPRRPGWFNR